MGTIYKPDLPSKVRKSAGFRSSGSGSRVLPWLHFIYTKVRTLGNRAKICRLRSSAVQVNGSLEDVRSPPLSSDFGTPERKIKPSQKCNNFLERSFFLRQINSLILFKVLANFYSLFSHSVPKKRDKMFSSIFRTISVQYRILFC